MRTLVIDTATKACSVALFDGHSLIAESHVILGRGHAEHLLPRIAEFPEQGRSEVIMVDVGPGSFTGIRIGVSVGKALALAWKAECLGYDCMQLIAAMARSQSGDAAAVDVIMTGGHGEFFFQSFDTTGFAVSPLASLSIDDVAAVSKADIVAGDAAALLGERRESALTIEITADARAWTMIAHYPAIKPSAIYGRPPDAKPMISS